MPLPLFFDLTNALTPAALARTLFYQVVVLGLGISFSFVKGIPFLNRFLGLHPITDSERQVLHSNPFLRVWFRNAKKWFDHPIITIGYGLVWGIGFIAIVGTQYILLTDIGWVKTLNDGFQWTDFLMARASGAPNGAHLLSYIPLPFLAIYVGWKYRKGIFLDVFQGVLIVAVGVAIHELVWIVAYWARYAVYWNLALLPNIAEDIGFVTMCFLFLIAFWKYPLRTMPLRIFMLPTVLYATFIAWWYSIGLPITTINNFQVGKGIYMTTALWADPLTNAIEIASWILVTVLMFGAIYHEP